MFVMPPLCKPARSDAALQPAAIVVTAKKPRTWRCMQLQGVDDPEADARVAAFFERAIQPR